MVEEAYVSFEVAKLLKEKKFDEITFTWYNGKGKFYIGKNNYDDYHMNRFSNMESEVDKNKCSAPTQQRAMKWLREKYYIYADPIKQGNYNDCSEYYTWIVARMGIIHRNPSVADKLSYEEAAEAALKYSLENLI